LGCKIVSFYDVCSIAKHRDVPDGIGIIGGVVPSCFARRRQYTNIVILRLCILSCSRVPYYSKRDGCSNPFSDLLLGEDFVADQLFFIFQGSV